MSLILDVDAAAAATGIPASTIRRWVTQRRLQAHQRRPVAVDVEAVLRERERATRTRHANLRRRPNENFRVLC